MRNNRPTWFRPFDLVVFGYLICACGLAWKFQLRLSREYFFNYEVDLQFLTVVLLNLYIFIIGSAIRAKVSHEDPEWCGPKWRTRLRKDYLTAQHAVDLLRALLLLKIVLVTYGCVKQAIPLLHSRLFDSELLWMDIKLHAGLNQMTWLTSLFPQSAVARFLDTSYFAWYYIKATIVAVFCVVKDRRLHQWFFQAFFLLWIVGGLCAVLLPSLGPVYTNPEWFTQINSPIAKSLQEQLRFHYEQLLLHPVQPSIFSYEGIAAFPSLHVGIMALAALFAFQLAPWFGWVMVVYTTLIQIGSVYLGWHYALDGYFCIVLAYAVYRVVRPKISNP